MTRGQGGPEGGEEGGRTAGEVGGHLEHAAATLSDGFCDHDDLVHIGESSGDQHATRVTVAAESVRAEADRPGLDGLLDAVRDGLLLLQRQAVGVRPAAHVALVAALVAQHEGAHAAVADHRGQVDGVAQLVERLQVLGVGFPLDALDLPARPGVDGRGRDVLDAFEQVDHKVAVLLAAVNDRRGVNPNGTRRLAVDTDQGAAPTPQLPMMIVVTPPAPEGESSGSAQASS